ncbi:MAG: UDP-N-acetylmuramoyl-tripeptide--D-alanyl-D-alanine ligase [Prevotella sp.]|nr:UDP-N-acetylmuramoyl-tripeptide--D-alanyl-D-alanine ligase [Prevotella sp.]
MKAVTELYSIFLEHPVVTTDSRDCPEGSIFFALKGDTFNGNAYAKAALDKGCAYAVIDEAQYAEDDRYIVVDDVLTTLQQLAREHRRALNTPIIGITGTNGKTTTKELVATVLSKKYNVLYTQGNFNNHIGVPKTLLRLTKEHDIAVIEMGANHPGEIKTLVEIVEPNCGLITNVGKAHIEGFGSFEGVIRTKGELYDFLRQKADSKVFIDTDNEHLMGISEGLNLVPYVGGEVIACDPFLRFRWSPEEVQDALRASSKVQDASLVQEVLRQGSGEQSSEPVPVPVNVPVPVYEVSTHLIGAYNMKNMLAAATVGLEFGITPEQINEALAGYVPTNNRSQLTITQHNKLIVDTYNANPTSMMAALHNFVLMSVEPKMAILGDMGELGSISHEEHQKIVSYLQDNHISNVWLVGKEFGKIESPYRKFANVADVKEALAKERPEGQYILIKGSNSNRLFELPELL